jgi:hypothetical protein
LPMPLPKHTPVASRSSSLVAFQAASFRAMSLAATAYCVKVDIRLWSEAVSQSAALHWPSSCPAGTMPATVLVSSCHLACGCRDATLTIPQSPASNRVQVRRMPTPRGVTAPSPVTTTRRMAMARAISYRNRWSGKKLWSRNFGELDLSLVRSQDARRLAVSCTEM